MSSQVSAPVSTTTVALDVPGAEAADAGVSASFDEVLAVARELGFVTQEPTGLNLTLTLSPEAALGAALRQLAGSVAGFEEAAPPLRVRAVVHHGVVFRTESAGQVSYVGSAIRSAQSALRRAPVAGGMMATRDFTAYAAKFMDLPFSLVATGGAAAADGMSQVVFADNAAALLRAGDRLASADPAFVEFVKRRLAEDLGPFASALVERAIRSAATATQMVPAVSRDIDDPEARARFEKDALRYIKSRTKK